VGDDAVGEKGKDNREEKQKYDMWSLLPHVVHVSKNDLQNKWMTIFFSIQGSPHFHCIMNRNTSRVLESSKEQKT
jgi:hypothetical protein